MNPDPESHATLVVRCDGSAALGMGHVSRCLALAGELRALGASVRFAQTGEPVAVEMVRGAGFAVDILDSETEEEGLRRAIDSAGAHALVVDLRKGLSRRALERIRGEGVLTVVIDDPHDRRLAADLAFYPPVPQFERLTWEGFSGTVLSGFEWVILGQIGTPSPVLAPKDRPRVVVAMGGSDPPGMTLRAVEELAALGESFVADVVLGPAFTHEDAWASCAARDDRRIRVHRRIRGVGAFAAGADLGLIAYGVTAWELAAAGVPALYIAFSDEHAEAALALADVGAGRILGRVGLIPKGTITEAVRTLLPDRAARRAMSDSARRHVDGRGATRVASRILGALD